MVNIFLSLVSGAAAGYATNSLAVSMLFKKIFGRWGGVIERYYNEFIDGMSQLVESDLVNQNTLKDELRGGPFRAAAAVMCRAVLAETLPALSGSVMVCDIPGMDESAVHLEERLKSIEPACLRELSAVFENTALAALCSPAQIDHVLHNVCQILLSEGRELGADTARIAGALAKERQAGDFLEHDDIQKIAHNVKNIIESIDFNDIKDDVYKCIDTSFFLIDWDEVSAAVKGMLGGMSMGDMLGQSRLLPPEIRSSIIDFMRSREGRYSAVRLVEAVFDEAAAVKNPLCEIIDAETEAAFVLFVERSLKGIFDDICLLIRGCTNEIETLINDTVDEELNSSPWGAVLKSFKDLFTGNFAAETQIVSEIIKVIEEGRSGLIGMASESIHHFIREKSVGGAFDIFAEKCGIDAENTALYAEYVLCGMAEKSVRLPDGFYNAQIFKFVTIDFSSIKENIHSFVKHRASEYIAEEGVRQKLACTAEKKIGDFGSDSGGKGENGANWGRLALFAESPAAAEAFGKAACGGIERLQNNAQAKDALLKIRPFVFLNSIVSGRRGIINWGNLWQKMRHLKLEYIYKRIQREDVFEKSAGIVSNLIYENLEMIVSGNVSKLVYGQLSKCTPPQINTLVQDFMGKELKPINILGAILGAAAGVISVFVFSVFNIFNTGLNPLTILIYCVIFAGVGIGTNALAIRMLFRPYKKILFNVPPFIGVAALRKPAFAKSIANFVRKEVLSEQSIHAAFTSNAGSIQQSAAGFLQADNYAILDVFIHNVQKQKKISTAVFNKLKSALTGDSKKMAERLFNTLGSAQAASAGFGWEDDAAAGIARRLTGAVLGGAAEQAVSGWAHRTAEKKIAALLPSLRGILGRALEERYTAAVTALDAGKCAAFLSRQNGRFMAFAAANSLDGLFGSSLNKTAADAAAAAILGAARPAFARKAADFWDKNLSAQVQVEDLFGGMLEKNLDRILELLQNALWAKRHIIAERILSRMNFAVRAAAGEQITAVVNALIKDKLPVFLQAHKPQIAAILHRPLQQSYADAGLTRLTECKENIIAQADCIFAAESTGRQMQMYAEKLVSRYTEIPLDALLAMFNIWHIDGLLEIIRPRLPDAVQIFCRTFAGEQFARSMINAAFDILEKTAADIKIAALLDGLDAEKITARVFNAARSNTQVNSMLQDIFLKYIKIILSENSIINKDLFISNINDFVNSIDDDKWNEIEYITEKYINILCKYINSDITAPVKDTLLSGFLLEAVLAAFGGHGHTIINSIDIKNIVEKEINRMSPKEIEVLFYKFAGPYFTKIILYGWIGAAGGLISLLLR